MGSPFSAAGSGFTASSRANVTFDATVLTPTGGSNCQFTGFNITTDPSGAFTCSFTVPTETPGPYNVTGIDATTSTDTNTVTFTVLPAITVTPLQGWVGSSFSVMGSGFTASATATVSFNTNNQAPIACSVGTHAGATIATDSTGAFTCTFTVPMEAPGSYNVVGRDITTSTTTNPVLFTVPPPAITVTPGQGPAGSTVMVSGTGFTDSRDLASLLFDSVPITSSSLTSGSLTTNNVGAFTCTFDVPSGTSGATVNATDVGGLSAIGSFVVTTPAITVAPGQGPVGSTFIVMGSGFTLSSGAMIAFNGVDLTPRGCSVGSFISVTITTNSTGGFSCSFTVPPVDSPGPYAVVGTDGATTNTTSPATFTVTTLAITVTPGQGPVGATGTVSGTGFSVSTPLALLFFDGVTIIGCPTGSLTADSTGAFSCGFTVPRGTTGTTVTAKDAGGQSAMGSFTVTALTLSATPGQGPVGATVTASGSGFSVSTTLTSLVFDGVAINSCSTGSLTAGSTGAFSCEFTVPSGTSGTTVTAKDAGGQSATGSFMVTPLTVTIAPGQGPLWATVTISGTGFSVSTPLALLFFDGVTITGCSTGSLTADSTGAFSCGFTVPRGTTGTTVTAKDVGGQSAMGSFKVTSPAVAVTPGHGPVGSPFTVVGSGFAVMLGATVSLDGIDLAPTACWVGGLNGTTITTDSSGGFSCSFTVSIEPGGNGTITATQGSNHPSTSFLVTPSFTISSNNGEVGATINATGTGFTGSAQYALMWNSSTTLCSGSTNVSGEFACAYTVPSASAGLHTINATQGTSNVGAPFSVIPSFTISPSTGTVGTSVTVSGEGFESTAVYIVSWNATTSLCTGITSTNGGFTCTFVVPSSAAGSNTITTSEGSYATTFSFKVAVSPPPPPSSSSSFPWWVVAVIAIVGVALLMVALVFAYRRPRSAGHLMTSHPRHVASPAQLGTAVQPWDGSGPSPPDGMPSSVSTRATVETPVGAASVAATETTPDIDELIARLERMSVELFKKTPKQLSEEPAVGESAEPANDK
ncbi:MAG: hypothetical protein ABSE66_07725 [Thermoplasmata archaeon]